MEQKATTLALHGEDAFRALQRRQREAIAGRSQWAPVFNQPGVPEAARPVGVATKPPRPGWTIAYAPLCPT